MDITTIGQAISTFGFPIVACVGLSYFCVFMINKNTEQTNKMLDMYDRANTQNREAIENCTRAIDTLCDKLDNIDHSKK